MRTYIDIINESNFLFDSYTKLKPLNEKYVFEDFRALYQKSKSLADKVLSSGRPWESAAKTMLGKTMSPGAASQFLDRAMSIASSAYQGGKAAAAVLALCGVVMLSHNANAAQMDDNAIQATLQQVAPVGAASMAPDVQPNTPEGVTANTPDAVQTPLLRTPDAAPNAIAPAAAPTLRTPADNVTRRPLSPAGGWRG